MRSRSSRKWVYTSTSIYTLSPHGNLLSYKYISLRVRQYFFKRNYIVVVVVGTILEILLCVVLLVARAKKVFDVTTIIASKSARTFSLCFIQKAARSSDWSARNLKKYPYGPFFPGLRVFWKFSPGLLDLQRRAECF